MSMSTIWGTTPEERAMDFPCDHLMDKPDAVYYRGITINACPRIVFRWLCQMRIAPYSYDWVDNWGHQSPQRLIAGVDEPALGQQFLKYFILVSFEYDQHLTLQINQKYRQIFGNAIASYVVVPNNFESSRLLVKILMKYPSGIHGLFLKAVLPLGDFIMMRKQFLNFKKLAEQTARGSCT